MSATSASRTRFTLIDGLRGIGAVSIALYHIFRYGPLPEAAYSVLPAFVETLISHGWMAVQWFFVITGFGVAYSTLDQPLSAAGIVRFIVRRTIRLGIAYWVTIAFVCLLTIFAIEFLGDRSLNEHLPTFDQVAAHAVFVQDILHYDPLTTGIWFIAIDMQFGIAFVVLLALAQWSAARTNREATKPEFWHLAVWFGPLTLWSLFVLIRHSSNDVWFIHYLSMPMLGAILCWTLHGRLRPIVFWGYVVLMVAQTTWQFCIEIVVALIAGLTLYAAARLGKLETGLSNPVLQYLGRISYSLFLIHYPVSWLVGWIGIRLTGVESTTAVAWLLTELVASIGAAHLLYTFVEQPALNWAKRFH